MASSSGRRVLIPLTNKSGGAVAAGDVVVIDTTTNESFTTTTTASFGGAIGIAWEAISNNATGRVAVAGYVDLVNVSASVTRGDFGYTHTVAKQAAANSTRSAGAFCAFLKSGTTPSAWLFGLSDGAASAGLSDHSAFTYLDPTVAAAPSTPASGKMRLYGVTGKLLAYKDDGGNEYVMQSQLPLDAAAAEAIGSGDHFAGTSLAGAWTDLQSTAVTSKDRSAADFVRLTNTSNTSGKDRGIQKAFSPAGDFTVSCKINSFVARQNTTWCGLFIGASDPSDGASGNRLNLNTGFYSGVHAMKSSKWAAGTETGVWGSTALAGTTFHGYDRDYWPTWLRIGRVGSTISYYWSFDGVVWRVHPTTTTISFTVATIGLLIGAATSTEDFEAVFDWIATTG